MPKAPNAPMKPHSTRWRQRMVLFLVGAVVGGAGMYWIQSYRHQTGVFERNQTPPPGPRTRTWAQPQEVAGVANFHKVSDVLYRGAQPSAEGLKNLHKMGIRTVVNLRALHSDRDEIGDLPLGYEHIRMVAWKANDDESVEFLKIVSDKSRQPVFVHCQHGSDRTGTMCAIYRIAIQGWSKEEAIEEMTRGGFGFHAIWDDLVEYVRALDVPAIRKQAGLD